MIEAPSKRAIVTGAASGIGAALARSLAASGVHLGLVDRRSDALHEIADELDRAGAIVEISVLDVSEPPAVTAGFRSLADRLGGLDWLVNNAGVGNLKRLTEYTDVEWSRLVGVNLTGVFAGMRAAIPIMRSSGGGGSIVNVSSMSGVRPTFGEAPYSAAKAGVISLSQAAALEEGPAVRVNSVSPGFIRTPLNDFLADDPDVSAQLLAGTPGGRLGDIGDVIDAIEFLLSDRASYITGQNIVIDGGASLVTAQTHELLGQMVTPR